jgi:transposase
MEIERVSVPTPTRWEVVHLRKNGLTFREIESEIKCSKSQAQYIWAKYCSEGHVKDRPRRGRPPLINARGQRRIVRSVLSEPTIPLKQLEDREEVSRRTLSRILKSNGILSYKYVIKTAISPENMRKRVAWCRKYQNWKFEDWSRVIFSDESSVYKVQGRKFYKKRISDPPSYGSVTKQGSFPIKVMFWGCISSVRVGRLISIEGNMNGESYKQILENNLAQSFGGIANRSLYFQHDNAPIHTSKVVKDYVTKKRIKVIDWPPYSPDLNPIENIWALLKTKLPSNLENSAEVARKAREIWENLDTCILNNLYSSMSSRIQAVLDAQGGPTKY